MIVVTLSSCKKDDEKIENLFPLNGTSLKFEYIGDGGSTYILKFTETTWVETDKYIGAGGKPQTDTYSGTYTYDGTTVKITFEGESTEATIDGNKMNWEGDIYIKQ